jgi:hypothetical protein
MATPIEIWVEGYGSAKGTREWVKVARIDRAKGHVITTFHEDGDDYEVPFRLVDGCVIGSSPEGGYVIPSETLAELKKESTAPAANLQTAVAGGKSGTVRRKLVARPTTTNPATAGHSKGRPHMAAQATSEKPTAGKRTKTTPAAVKATVETTAAKNGKSNGTAPPAAAKPAATVKKPATATAKKAEATEPAPVTKVTEKKTPVSNPVSRKKTTAPAPAEEPAGELSPMELAAQEGIARASQKVGEGETRINIAPLMYRQIVWNEIRPYPDGRRVPGFRDFKRAFDNAAERSYVYVVVNEAAAKFLVLNVFKAGFERNWTGTLAGGFKRGAKRLATMLAETYGFELPPVIANHVVGKGDEEEEPKPKRSPGRPKGAKNAAPAAAGKASKPATAAKPAATAKPAAAATAKKKVVAKKKG